MSPWPELDREPVRLPALAGPLGDIWQGLADLAAAADDLPWTIVGGQMVLLHGLEHARTPDRVTNDIDTAVDVRTDQRAVARLVAVLTDLGYKTAGTSPEGHAYRFEKRSTRGSAVVDVLVADDDGDARTDLVVDVLVPEGLGPRTDTRTVGQATAFPVPGVTQALRRTELVPVDVHGRSVWIPRPNLLGAIVAKATASGVDARDTGRHHTDLVFLCSLVDDPFGLGTDVDSKDRQRLSRAARILPAEHAAWRADPDALTALEILIAGR